jgi:hypothetical protein
MSDISIINTFYTVDDDGAPLLMRSIEWVASMTQQNVTMSLLPIITDIPSDYTPAQKPYADVTEVEATQWVTEIEAEKALNPPNEELEKPYDYWERIDLKLQSLFTEVAAPMASSGLPWVSAYPTWVSPHPYALRDVVAFDGQSYECLQAHTSQIDWQPPMVPALWKVFVPVDAGPQPWVQPTGAQDAYPLGAQVTHNGHLWTSTYNDNVWEPGVFGWTDEGPL